MKWLVIVAVVVRASVAHAGSQGIVLESYTKERPAAAQKQIEALLGELSQRGFTTGADVASRFEGGVSKPAAGQLPAKFGDQVAAGLRAWASGKFEDAIATVQPLVTAAHDAPGAFIGNAKVGDSLQTALIVLALSQQRMGDPGAQATWTELVRSFPAATVPKSTYGPDAEKQFAAAKAALATAPKGHLLVKLDDESGDVYINERLEHRGTTAKDVLPGDYRIVVQLGSKRSRAHRVTVAANQDVRIEIDPTFDAAVVTTGWAGFQFANASDRSSDEGPYAAQFAKAIQADSVVVVGVDGAQLFGSVFLFNGKPTKHASIALDATATPEKIAQLAGFLAGEKVTTAGINIDLDTGPAPGPGVDSGTRTGPVVGGPSGPHDEVHHHRWIGWPVITGVIALGAGGVGGYLLSRDGKCKDGSNDPNCPDVYNNKGPGFGALAGAAVFAGITVYLIVTMPHDAAKPAKTMAVVPTDGGALATLGGTW